MDQQNNVSQTEIDERVSRDLKQIFDGKLESEKIDFMITQAKTNSVYKAEFRAVGYLVYTHYWIWTPDAESPNAKFNGNGGGLVGPAQGGKGYIYTDDYEALINNTTSFAFYGIPAYYSIYFYDKHSNLLGHLQAVGIGSVGAGGGTGQWTRNSTELKD
ncbi:VapA/VapB family virulence-associated protein [Bacillus cereus]|uniref:VapA/VapB family virulence-associated protein n=1 Tax=Bacillus cereus TaxID=1396 RepID=UPI003D17FAF3